MPRTSVFGTLLRSSYLDLGIHTESDLGTQQAALPPKKHRGALASLYENANQNPNQQHDDRASDRHPKAFQTLQPSADAFISQSANLFVRVKARFGLINGGHPCYSTGMDGAAAATTAS